jgi:hypothetical protein
MDVNDINFVDFNGVVSTMSIEEAMKLTELPQPNEYDNLTFEGWTKTLEEIQDGRCHTIGATYHTTDGAWDVWVNIPTDNYKLENMGDDKATNIIDWGDSSPQKTVLGRTGHTYQKKGIYRLKINTNGTTQPWYDQQPDLQALFVEIHIPQSATIINTRNMKALEKISIPDNGLDSQIGGWGLTGNVDKLQYLVLGNSLKGQLSNWRYGGAMLYGLKYLVADGFTGTWDSPMHHVSLRAFSLKNTQTVSESKAIKGYYPNYQFLRHVVFENVTSIGGNCFRSGRRLKLVDFGEPISSIANNSFQQGVAHVYIRSLTPPTLGGTTVFWYQDYSLKTTIHIRKDATYTDAAGTTYTGLEAYAHATNWATLYASSNYTFIDDL